MHRLQTPFYFLLFFPWLRKEGRKLGGREGGRNKGEERGRKGYWFNAKAHDYIFRALFLIFISFHIMASFPFYFLTSRRNAREENFWALLTILLCNVILDIATYREMIFIHLLSFLCIWYDSSCPRNRGLGLEENKSDFPKVIKYGGSWERMDVGMYLHCRCCLSTSENWKPSASPNTQVRKYPGTCTSNTIYLPWNTMQPVSFLKRNLEGTQ